jgi:hypothetical protein
MEGMRTYHARLSIEDKPHLALDAYGELFGHALHALHAQKRANRVVSKPVFMRDFGLTARQFNAVSVSLEGAEGSVRERLPQLLSEERLRLASTHRRLARSTSAFKRHHLSRRAARIEARIAAWERNAADDVPRICFGSRKLFRAQHALEANGFGDHASWLSAWRDSRSNSFFVLGSKDETAGCQGCVLTHRGDGHFLLSLRLPKSSLLKRVTLQVRFRYGWEHLAWALDTGQAISYRFIRATTGVGASSPPPRCSRHPRTPA